MYLRSKLLRKLPAVEFKDFISNVLNISEDVMRYLLVTVDEKGKKALEEAKSNASNDEVKEVEE